MNSGQILTPGFNPMNGLQACIYKLANTSAFLTSLVVNSVFKFNPPALVFTCKH